MKFWFKDNFEILFQQSQDDKKIPVTLKQCFPKTHPKEYLSILDKENKQLVLIDHLDDLDGESKAEIIKYLNFKNFKIELTKIYSIEDDYGLRIWNVETKSGPRKFQVELQAWPQSNEDGSIYIEDISGDIYTINNVDILDKDSQGILGLYVDI